MTRRFAPAHAAHAIEHVSASIGLDVNISADAWLKVFRRTEECARSLGLEAYREALNGSLQASVAKSGGVNLPTFGLAIQGSGASFGRMSDDGSFLQSITATRNEVKVESKIYVRWSGFEEVLSEVVSKILGSYPADINIDNIRLEYQDRFVDEGAGATAPQWDEVIRSGEYVSSAMLRKGGLWHNHVGWFEEDISGRRKIINLNIDTNEEPVETGEPRRAISVYTLVGAVASVGSAQEAQAVMTELNALHDRSKGVLRSILTPTMQKRISLDIGEQEA